MLKKYLLYIGVIVGIIAIITSISISNTEITSILETTPELEFTYSETNLKLKQNLEPIGIFMSSPINLINKNSLDKFCSFFTDEIKQKLVEFCTSTELLDSEGNFLGNIHMIGSRNMPKIVLVVIQTNPFMENLDQIKLVFEVVVDNLVCNCWEEFKPSGIETVSQWVDEQREFHLTDTRPTSASDLDLMNKNLQMELSTNNEGYLWKLLISG